MMGWATSRAVWRGGGGGASQGGVGAGGGENQPRGGGRTGRGGGGGWRGWGGGRGPGAVRVGVLAAAAAASRVWMVWTRRAYASRSTGSQWGIASPGVGVGGAASPGATAGLPVCGWFA